MMKDWILNILCELAQPSIDVLVGLRADLNALPARLQTMLAEQPQAVSVLLVGVSGDGCTRCHATTCLMLRGEQRQQRMVIQTPLRGAQLVALNGATISRVMVGDRLMLDGAGPFAMTDLTIPVGVEIHYVVGRL